MGVEVYGIRHHGPGSAWSLLQALRENRPDLILVEGPPDAEPVVAFAAHEEMRPPVALMVYDVENPARHAFYPFAVFSPEWQALRFALANGIPVRFMDLPLSHQLAPVRGQSAGDPENQVPEEGVSAGDIEPDPMRWMALAAGFEDTERWWESVVEHRRDKRGLFAAVAEMMTALRAEFDRGEDSACGRREARREAWMRQTIRAALKEGFANIAVVCGAWHAPALEQMPPAAGDAALLKGLPKTKVQATWVPWTSGRLSLASGYGAGIESPGWYEHLWRCREEGLGDTEVTVRWMVRVARTLREEDLDASSASVIEAVRLAESLSSLRQLPLPGLVELNEATRSVLCFGDDLPLRLVNSRLVVGEKLGQVPSETPAVALQLDLEKTARRLRLPRHPEQKLYDLDLRKPNDLERSHLLHRLRFLNIPWGILEGVAGQAKGTFHEVWTLRWQPEFAVRIVEAGMWGTSIRGAAAARAVQLAGSVARLGELTSLAEATLLADLPDAVGTVLAELEKRAAVSGDIAELMHALPPLASALRYGNVRRTDADAVRHLVDGLVVRISVGLPLACASLDDDAAGEMLGQLQRVDESIRLLQVDEHLSQWMGALTRLADQQGLHGLVAGSCTRMLLDAGEISPDTAATRLSRALSTAADPAQAGQWAEGFLRGSGLVLLLDANLWSVVDGWVRGLRREAFVEVLPLMRRAFAGFSPGERRQLGEKAKAGSTSVLHGDDMGGNAGLFDRQSARAVLPLLRLILSPGRDAKTDD